MENELDDPVDMLFGGATVKVERPRPTPPASYQGTWENCRKCAGSGMTRWGVCFACQGKRGRYCKTSAADRAKGQEYRAQKKVRTAAENLEFFAKECPDVWAWMDGSSFPFAVSLRESVMKYGSLTERQLEAARNAIAKRDAAKAAGAARVSEAKAVDMTNITEAFGKAGRALKAPRLRVQGLTIYPAKKGSRNEGSLYVRGLSADKSEELYLGRITEGRFIRSKECSLDLEAKVLEVAADPKKAAANYGRLTGHCAICSRLLTAEESVGLGIGPICAERFGW